MPLSMHALCVPVFQRQLGAMLAWLDKAEAHAQARGFDTANYLSLRLAPDMLPMVSQVRIASDVAKGAVSRLAGVTPPVFEDNEATFDELRARIRRTLEHLEAVPAADVDAGEAREIVLPRRHGEPLRFSGTDYVRHWVLPNFLFHCTTCYALLRHAGVPLGKADFLAG